MSIRLEGIEKSISNNTEKDEIRYSNIIIALDNLREQDKINEQKYRELKNILDKICYQTETGKYVLYKDLMKHHSMIIKEIISSEVCIEDIE